MLSRFRRLHPVRLARPMARRPGTMAIVAALICALTGLGFIRFAVDAGPDLLVGQSSQTKQVYDRFSSTFGSDPIVVVLSVQNPTALYLEKNLLRLGALESDIARDPRVAAVLGPGTIAGSAQAAAAGEITRVRQEYPYFVAETALAAAIQQGTTDPTKLSSVESNAYQAAQVAMAADIVKATEDADTARAAYDKQPHPDDQTLRGRELAAEAASSQTPAPPLFAQYLAGPRGTADNAGAQALFDQLAAGFGNCSDDIATALHVNATCQVFLERLFLDLPHCPKVDQAPQFCPPKQQWAAVLPKPTGDRSLAVLTIRLKPSVIGHADQVNGLVSFIRNELQNGQPHSPSTVVRSLGPYDPTECGTPDTSNGPSACDQHFHDAPAQFTIAGAPLLVQGVVGSMTHLLLALFPVAFLVMLLLLLGAFRVRGRIWPLVGAAGAALLTVGGGLVLGVSISPAVLAGVPVLVGLGVDYAVQLVARFSEERRRRVGLEAALRLTLGNTGPATLIAGTATLAGVVALAVVTGIDLGPLVAVPLVAEFALVLCAGVIFSWLAAVFVALPAAAWGERRREARFGPAEAAAVEQELVPAARRTGVLATRWRAVLVPTVLLALVGWALMPRLPIETGVEQLLAPSLSELRDIQSVRGQLGYDNEIDLAVEGSLGGSNAQATVPDSVVWMAQAGQVARCLHPGDVALATTIGDVFAASAQQSTPNTSCQGGAPSPSPSPAPSPSVSPSASPSSSPSPSARRTDGDVAPAGRAVLAATTPSPTAAPTPSAAPPSGSAAPATPVPTPSITSPSASGTLQTAFLCNLRLLPTLARNLIGPIPDTTQPCPARDLYRNVFLGSDPSPISPKMARIALGVRLTSVADQAKLIDQIHNELPPQPKGLTTTPTGLTALAAQAYENLTGRILLFNLVPLAVVALVLLAIFREPRRAFLPVLPAALAAGWSSLIVDLLGRIPGAAGTALGSLNPLTVVLGALVIALGTEFGVVLLQRFYEERASGRDPDAAAGAALHAVGRAVLVSAATLGAGFAVLAVSGPVPGGLPLIADFGLAVLIDLALAVGAVFLVMLPLAVALERSAPLELPAPVVAGGGFRPRTAGGAAPVPARPKKFGRGARPQRMPAPPPTPPTIEEPAAAAPQIDEEPVWSPPAATGAEVATPPPPDAAEPIRRFPGVSGRRHPAAPPPPPPPELTPLAELPPVAPLPPARLPGVSGRRRSAPAAPPAPAEPPRRRMPGGVTRRVSGMAPPPDAPPAPPAPPAEPAASAPPTEPLAPPTPQGPHQGPDKPRSRRRRPPPWMRHRTPPPGGGSSS